jgi:hypothetical protein
MRVRDKEEGWDGYKEMHPLGCSYMNKYNTSQHVMTHGASKSIKEPNDSVGRGASHVHAICKTLKS